MNIFMIAAPAGGVGRTTLAAWLALYAEEAGEGLVVALDANDEPTLVRWGRDEKLSRPVTAAWDASCTRESLESLADEGVGLVLVDGPGPEHGERIAEVLAAVDLALIVVRPRGEDLDAVGDLIDLVESAGKPFVFVLNQASEDEDMTAATAISLAQHGPVSPVILPKSAALALPARDPGGDAPPDRLVAPDHIARLWTYLRDRMARTAGRPEAGGPGPDRARSARHAYVQDATFILADMVYPCHVMDISDEGVSFSSDDAPPPGSRLGIYLPYLGRFDCDVVESRPEKVDVRLVIDDDRRAVLLDQVAALVDSSREQASPERVSAAESGSAQPAGDRPDLAGRKRSYG